MAQVLKGSAAQRQGAVGGGNSQMRVLTGQQQQGMVGMAPVSGTKAGNPGGPPTQQQPASVVQGMSPTAASGNLSVGGHAYMMGPQQHSPQQKGGSGPSPLTAGVSLGTPIVGSGAGAVNGTVTVAPNQGTQSQGSQQRPANHQQQPLQGKEQPETESMANTKEKTPMCLINELARFNKIQHQYTLTDEQGPAHKKIFYVKLKLGDEEYASSGPSIKKAQHAAAEIALDKTQYKHPPPKPPRNPTTSNSITPTVELNALAMRRGELASYRPIEMPRPQFYPPPSLDFRGMYNQRYHYPKYPRVFYVSLKVGQREFIGEGNTRQAARHSAAEKALKILNNLPLPREMPGADDDKKEEAETDGKGAAGNTEESIDDLKSEISLVHEIALKRNFHVNFEVIKESGPPHMRNFVTRCTCGEYKTEAEGNSKKLSKKRAAEKMLEELQRLPSLPQPANKPKKTVATKKKNRNLIKVVEDKANMDYGVGINPISRLIQIQQAKKEKEPVYTLIAERGVPRRREFVMQVTVGEQTCTGVGPNKKLAKRNAAEAMLQQLGYSRPTPQPSKSAIKMGESSPAGDKKVTFVEQEQHGSRQVVPGVILMPSGDGSRSGVMTAAVNAYGPMQNLTRSPVNHLNGLGDMAVKYSPQTTAAIAKELLDTGSSPTAESITKVATRTVQQSAVRPKQQLLYLADVLGFQVQFTDFPKGSNKSEFLSLVSLSTNPPQVSHGAGPTLEISHDQAALTALRSLAELGLDLVTDMKKESDKMASGDGPHIKSESGEKLANSLNSKDLNNAALKKEQM